MEMCGPDSSFFSPSPFFLVSFLCLQDCKHILFISATRETHFHDGLLHSVNPPLAFLSFPDTSAGLMLFYIYTFLQQGFDFYANLVHVIDYWQYFGVLVQFIKKKILHDAPPTKNMIKKDTLSRSMKIWAHFDALKADIKPGGMKKNRLTYL